RCNGFSGIRHTMCIVSSLKNRYALNLSLFTYPSGAYSKPFCDAIIYNQQFLSCPQMQRT
ncbi:MAG: hypothetical protein QNK40_02940, partial [Desulfobacterales bacterium]|nr:hypothetical protein [Desulfobacterales bacterium]MDX2508361.1 hypothetical protein [Desulfobacterales bacterium]